MITLNGRFFREMFDYKVKIILLLSTTREDQDY